MAKKKQREYNVFHVRRINRKWVVVNKQFAEEFIYSHCRTRSLANEIADNLNYREELYLRDRQSNWCA